MPRFFTNEPPQDGTMVIHGDDARHIGRSLRMRLGDEIVLCYNRTDYACEILKISDEAVMTQVLRSRPSSEPNINLTLYMAMPKSDKLETVIQKSVELGAVRIVPVLTSRCIARPDKSQFSKKLDRLQRVALEAAKQSGRGIIPEVCDIINLEQCITQMKNNNQSFVLYENGGKSLADFEYLSGSDISILVGAEGGFDASEISKCKDAGIEPIWLGDRILRCETAPIVAISIIMHRSGNI